MLRLKRLAYRDVAHRITNMIFSIISQIRFFKCHFAEQILSLSSMLHCSRALLYVLVSHVMLVSKYLAVHTLLKACSGPEANQTGLIRKDTSHTEYGISHCPFFSTYVDSGFRQFWRYPQPLSFCRRENINSCNGHQ